MHRHELDNPVWQALQTAHAEFAIAQGGLRRYPADVAPFVAAERDGADGSALNELMQAGEAAYLLGVKPTLPPGWLLKGPIMLAQMLCAQPLEVIDGPPIIELGAAHAADIQALAALVYPHYFRARTTALGRYFGLYVDGRLAAMIGERMRTAHCIEISAVCTHPDYLGRGYARRLLAHLSNAILAQDRLPFLHVNQDNLRARRLYEQNGYGGGREIAFYALKRPE